MILTNNLWIKYKHWMHGAKSVNRIIKRINILKVVVLFSIKSKKLIDILNCKKFCKDQVLSFCKYQRVGSIDHDRVGWTVKFNRWHN